MVYQLLRTAIADAASTRPGTGPDRASFTIAWQTARDQLISAANVIAGHVIDLAGVIGHHLLANLLPARRLRVSPRIVWGCGFCEIEVVSQLFQVAGRISEPRRDRATASVSPPQVAGSAGGAPAGIMMRPRSSLS